MSTYLWSNNKYLKKKKIYKRQSYGFMWFKYIMIVKYEKWNVIKHDLGSWSEKVNGIKGVYKDRSHKKWGYQKTIEYISNCEKLTLCTHNWKSMYTEYINSPHFVISL